MKILGYGACMIKGTPFGPECSFLHIATSRLKQNPRSAIQTQVVSLPSFDAPRAKKHIRCKLLGHKPNIVVIQFGSTDAAVPIRKHLGRIGGQAIKNTDTSITFMDVFKWHLKTTISTLLFLRPVTPEADYIRAMTGMVARSLSMQVTPIVISPFPFGSSRSDYFSRAYSNRLKSEIQGIKGAYFIDAYSELAKHPKSKTLCQDGFHISKFSHELISDLLVAEIKAIASTDTAELIQV
jgi:hypothetical protein